MANDCAAKGNAFEISVDIVSLNATNLHAYRIGAFVFSPFFYSTN